MKKIAALPAQDRRDLFAGILRICEAAKVSC
jgi:hypothetical protein